MKRQVGRPTADILRPDKAKGALALVLRQGRERRGLTRRQTAWHIGCSLSTIQRAEAGERPPSDSVLRGYIRVCGLPAEEVTYKWRRAQRAARGTSRRTLTPAPHPRNVRNRADFSAALRRVREEADSPPYRVIENRSENRWKADPAHFAYLPRSTAWRIAERHALPSSPEHLRSYLAGCDVPERHFLDWITAWKRVREREERAAATQARRTEQLRRDWGSHARFDAEAVMREAGLVPRDRYPGPDHPWAAYCKKCKSLSRFLLTSVLLGTRCPACQSALRPENRFQPAVHKLPAPPAAEEASPGPLPATSGAQRASGVSPAVSQNFH
jgi:transcriptional regulator with XRE-family HTH domain